MHEARYRLLRSAGLRDWIFGYQTPVKLKCPREVGCNLLMPACLEFLLRYGEKTFNQEHCVPHVSPQFYAYIGVYYYAKMGELETHTTMSSKNHTIVGDTAN